MSREWTYVVAAPGSGRSTGTGRAFRFILTAAMKAKLRRRDMPSDAVIPKNALGSCVDDASAVCTNFVVLVPLGPATPDQKAMDLAAQTQAEHGLEPHQGQADQTDCQGQRPADAAVRDDHHGQ